MARLMILFCLSGCVTHRKSMESDSDVKIVKTFKKGKRILGNLLDAKERGSELKRLRQRSKADLIILLDASKTSSSKLYDAALSRAKAWKNGELPSDLEQVAAEPTLDNSNLLTTRVLEGLADQSSKAGQRVQAEASKAAALFKQEAAQYYNNRIKNTPFGEVWETAAPYYAGLYSALAAFPEAQRAKAWSSAEKIIKASSPGEQSKYIADLQQQTIKTLIDQGLQPADPVIQSLQSTFKQYEQALARAVEQGEEAKALLDQGETSRLNPAYKALLSALNKKELQIRERHTRLMQEIKDKATQDPLLGGLLTAIQEQEGDNNIVRFFKGARVHFSKDETSAEMQNRLAPFQKMIGDVNAHLQGKATALGGDVKKFLDSQIKATALVLTPGGEELLGKFLRSQYQSSVPESTRTAVAAQQLTSEMAEHAQQLDNLDNPDQAVSEAVSEQTAAAAVANQLPEFNSLSDREPSEKAGVLAYLLKIFGSNQ